jgi:hypothetical protein
MTKTSKSKEMWSTVNVEYLDGTSGCININASPGIAPYLQAEADRLGSFVLRNPTQSVIVMSANVRSISLTELTSREGGS